MLMAMELAQELTARPGYTWTIANPKYLKALKVFTGTSSSLSLLGALTVIVFQACGSSLWPNKGNRHSMYTALQASETAIFCKVVYRL